jgi:hypothetical protein
MTQTLEDYERLAQCLLTIRDGLEACDSFGDLLEALEHRGYDQATLESLIQPRVSADLHVHSNHSDGNIPPRRLVWLARIMRLRALAIADHDNVSGVAEALEEGHRLGVRVVAAVEFQTGRPGLEILCYFPDSEAFVKWLAASASEEFRRYLESIQSATHESTLAVMPAVNGFLSDLGVSPESLLTYDELASWYHGQEPFYPGTLAVLGLKRLSASERDRLGIYDPRAFNTKVVTPALKAVAADRGGREAHRSMASLEGAFGLVRSARAHGIGAVTVLAHPKELVTKGRMEMGQIRDLMRDLVLNYDLDGVEVNNSRDDADDTSRWLQYADEVEREVEAGTGYPRRLIRFSFSSDFHVLNPGLASGEITMGYGMLDESESHRCGNLSPIGAFDHLWTQMVQRATLATRG